jgi:hypothetical protein
VTSIDVLATCAGYQSVLDRMQSDEVLVILLLFFARLQSNNSLTRGPSKHETPDNIGETS